MSTPKPPGLPEPGFSLEAPATYLYTGPASSRGWRLNLFCLSLKSPAAREQYLADEDAYVAKFGLAPAEQVLVRARDWTGLLEAGGHLQAVLKLAATLGLNIYHIGAHNVGTDAETLYRACPRRMAALPESGR
jgi:protocatechuate 4,5-dioxygenase alpha chain